MSSTVREGDTVRVTKPSQYDGDDYDGNGDKVTWEGHVPEGRAQEMVDHLQTVRCVRQDGMYELNSGYIIHPEWCYKTDLSPPKRKPTKKKVTSYQAGRGTRVFGKRSPSPAVFDLESYKVAAMPLGASCPTPRKSKLLLLEKGGGGG